MKNSMLVALALATLALTGCDEKIAPAKTTDPGPAEKTDAKADKADPAETADPAKVDDKEGDAKKDSPTAAAEGSSKPESQPKSAN